ncbi:MAG: nicotinate (nicotinamide) nucleotide adenylyltransferase [Clostridia bacterium]|nr:nicotinate (nicotinamide) nucleotide adenylyltransferase [Clostridia bacterium]
MKNKKQIIIFVGCFNPPHNTHFAIAEQILNQYKEVEKILFIPVNSKYKKAGLIENEHRYNMLELVCSQNEKFEISKIEIESNRALFTIETLEKLQQEYDEYEIGVMIGSDNLKELDTWHRAEDLVKRFKIYVLERAHDNIQEIIGESKLLEKNKKNIIKVSNAITSNLSSTFIRNSIKQGKSIQYLVLDEVIQYIKKNQLYQ